MNWIIILLILDLLAGVIDDLLRNRPPIPDLVFLMLLIVNLVALIRIARSDFRSRYGMAKMPGRAVRGVGYLWIFSLGVFLLSGQQMKQPWWATVLGLGWSGFLIWGTFRLASKTDSTGLHGEAGSLSGGIDATGLMRSAMKRRLIALEACLVVALTLLSFAFVRGLLSPRGLAFASLMLFIAFFFSIMWSRKRLIGRFKT